MHWTESHWVTEERCIFQYEGAFPQGMLMMYGVMHFHVFQIDILSFFLTPPPSPLNYGTSPNFNSSQGLSSC